MSETISGVCSEVSERGEWTTFHINIGKEWPVKLATKKPELVVLGRAASRSGAEMLWTYNEVESDKINEHTGKPFLNRYLEGVAPRDASQPVSETTEQVSRDGFGSTDVGPPDKPASLRPPLGSGDKDRVISRLACIKAAAELFRLADKGPEELVSDAIAAAARFETWVYRDVDQVPFS